MWTSEETEVEKKKERITWFINKFDHVFDDRLNLFQSASVVFK